MKDPRLEEYVATYQQMVDDQLLELVSQQEQLTPKARTALWAELGRRGIMEEALNRGSQDAPPASPPNRVDDRGWNIFGATTPQMPSSELAAVYSAGSGAEAQRVQELLSASGIESQLQIVILVPEAEAEKAFGLLKENLASDLEENKTGDTDEGISER